MALKMIIVLALAVVAVSQVQAEVSEANCGQSQFSAAFPGLYDPANKGKLDVVFAEMKKQLVLCRSKLVEDVNSMEAGTKQFVDQLYKEESVSLSAEEQKEKCLEVLAAISKHIGAFDFAKTNYAKELIGDDEFVNEWLAKDRLCMLKKHDL